MDIRSFKPLSTHYLNLFEIQFLAYIFHNYVYGCCRRDILETRISPSEYQGHGSALVSKDNGPRIPFLAECVAYSSTDNAECATLSPVSVSQRIYLINSSRSPLTCSTTLEY